MVSTHSLKYVFLFLSCIFALNFLSTHVSSLNIGAHTSISMPKKCSRKCESRFCSVAPLLKYGKYCGILYSGCSGETPCDDLDACCMMHDQCVLDNNYNYLSDECSQRMMKCMDEFKNSGAPTFNGNKCEVDHVIELINEVMEAVLELRKVFPKP